jgi:hypothetical protein
MLEHAIRLYLVERCLQKTFFFKLVVVIVADGSELLSLGHFSTVAIPAY